MIGLTVVRTAIVFALLSTTHTTHGAEKNHRCRMFPENRLYYPVTSGIAGTGVNQKTWDLVLDAVEKTYAPIFDRLGGRLILERDWNNPEVNAWAARDGRDKWIVHMFGGLARHPEMTPDGLLLVACHEIGHQIGGDPISEEVGLTAEGQADYFATLKCMRQVLKNFNNKKVVQGLADELERDVKKRCDYFEKKSADRDPEGKLICARSHLAAEALTKTLVDAAKSRGMILDVPRLDTPDERRVSRTIHAFQEYPELQCRYDTFINGAICGVALKTPMSRNGPNDGVCLRDTRDANLKRALRDNNGDSILDPHGARPACWYNQKEMEGA